MPFASLAPTLENDGISPQEPLTKPEGSVLLANRQASIRKSPSICKANPTERLPLHPTSSVE